LAVSGTAQLASHDPVTFVPEVGVNLGYEFGRHVRVFAGYTFLYWSDVVRPGVQFSRVVNPANAPTSLEFGSAAPAQLGTGTVFRHSDFWAQGVNIGVAFRY